MKGGLVAVAKVRALVSGRASGRADAVKDAAVMLTLEHCVAVNAVYNYGPTTGVGCPAQPGQPTRPLNGCGLTISAISSPLRVDDGARWTQIGGVQASGGSAGARSRCDGCSPPTPACCWEHGPAVSTTNQEVTWGTTFDRIAGMEGSDNGRVGTTTSA
ncbi:hypothetical protein GCM10020220_000720 [Nonomuraea rubra]